MTRYERSVAVAACALVLSGALVGCQSPVGNDGSSNNNGPSVKIDFSSTADEDDNGKRSAKGKGRYLLSETFDIGFSLKAKVNGAGKVNGTFSQSLIFQGQLVEFHGELTCLSVDEDNGRAWIGGVVTINNSEHPGFQEDIHQPGRDVWFRVLDSDEQPGNDPDRTTFLGFEGAAGFITSEEYCAAMPWPDDNDRTHPVTSGDIKVDGN